MSYTLETQGKRINLCGNVIYITTGSHTDKVVYRDNRTAAHEFQSIKRFAKR